MQRWARTCCKSSSSAYSHPEFTSTSQTNSISNEQPHQVGRCPDLCIIYIYMGVILLWNSYILLHSILSLTATVITNLLKRQVFKGKHFGGPDAVNFLSAGENLLTKSVLLEQGVSHISCMKVSCFACLHPLMQSQRKSDLSQVRCWHRIARYEFDHS